MAGLFGNLKSSLTQSIAEVSTQTSAQNQRQTDLSKIETNVKEIDIKLVLCGINSPMIRGELV